MGDWWIDPPRNVTAGGVIVSKASDDSVSQVDYGNKFYHVGFKCTKEWGFPLDLISDHYESYYNKSYVRFQIPTLSEVFDSALLHIMVALVENIQVGDTTLISLKCYYRSSYDATKFPWAGLDDDDQSDVGWTELGSLGTVAQIFTGYYSAGGPYWMTGLDISTAVQDAIDNGWTWLGFKLQLTEKAPIGWDYDSRPTSLNQLLDIRLQGALTVYLSNNLPPDFPASTVNNYVSPWLQASYVALPPEDDQEEPGEDYTTSSGSNPYPGDGLPPASGYVSCIEADPKGKSAIAGTSIGGLYYTYSGGSVWEKVYEVDSKSRITTVYMDYIKNMVDYPDNATAWFGTYDGDIYKSIDSLQSWALIKSFDYDVKKISGSNTDSNKVAAVVGTKIYTTFNGGDDWVESYEG